MEYDGTMFGGYFITGQTFRRSTDAQPLTMSNSAQFEPGTVTVL